jgi:hypothetical protein
MTHNNSLPAIPVDPARKAHERKLARALLMAQTDEAHEAACVAVARCYRVCLQCVADVLSLCQDRLAAETKLPAAVNTFLDEIELRQDTPLHDDECVLVAADVAVAP